MSSGGSVTPAPARGLGNKVSLGAGFSQMDWMRLMVQADDLAGLRGQRPRALTMAEVRAHNSLRQDFWMALHGKVYNVTRYVPYHPGGADELERALADDATKLFEEVHPWVSMGLLSGCEVGWLVDENQSQNPQTQTRNLDQVRPPVTSKAGLLARVTSRVAGRSSAKDSQGTMPASTISEAPSQAPASPVESEQKIFMESNDWVKCEVVAAEVSEVEHCFWIRIRVVEDISEATLQLMCEPGHYVKLMKEINGKLIERPFTPMLAAGSATGTMSEILGRAPAGPGEFDLFLKLYADSLMTASLVRCVDDEASIKEQNQSLKVQFRRAPMRAAVVDGRFAMAAYGAASFRRAKPQVHIDHICMVAQGTGVMPMLQILDYAALHNETASFPTFSMVIASRTEDEVPFREELAANKQLENFRVVLSSEGSRVNEDLLALHLGETYSRSPSDESSLEPGLRVVVCGSCKFAETVQSSVIKAGFPSSCLIVLS
mmetsp:Transcript_17294/g.33973  ORF Transcript_17294/g.33973 Transcript_17294/m.33973 type:complete len:489 (+) Transcript_17294:71-1537(+)